MNCIDYIKMQKKYKYLLIDLDGTIINTISGSIFPKGIWDMKFDFNVLIAIKNCKFDEIFILTNQGGVEEGYVDKEHWQNKAAYVCDCIKEYTNINCIYNVCYSTDKDNYRRKPNIGMVKECISYLDKKIIPISKDDFLIVGDASGLEGQFSDSDKKCAENAGIDYMDVKEFKKFNNEK